MQFQCIYIIFHGLIIWLCWKRCRWPVGYSLHINSRPARRFVRLRLYLSIFRIKTYVGVALQIFDIIQILVHGETFPISSEWKAIEGVQHS